MAQGPYNPQEVLAPLMKRLGRLFQAQRDEGYNMMLGVLREELHVDDENARRLLKTLEQSGLIAYEPAVAYSPPEHVMRGAPTAQPEESGAEQPAEGAWRIGPTI